MVRRAVLTRTRVALLLSLAACSSPARPEPAKPDPVSDVPPPTPGDVTQPAPSAPPAEAPVAPAAIADARAKLLAKYGEPHRERIERGVTQVAALWRTSDGDLAEFVVDQFAAEPKDRDALFAKLEATFEQLEGHVLEAGRTVRWGTEVESGPMRR